MFHVERGGDLPSYTERCPATRRRWELDLEYRPSETRARGSGDTTRDRSRRSRRQRALASCPRPESFSASTTPFDRTGTVLSERRRAQEAPCARLAKPRDRRPWPLAPSTPGIRSPRSTWNRRGPSPARHAPSWPAAAVSGPFRETSARGRGPFVRDALLPSPASPRSAFQVAAPRYWPRGRRSEDVSTAVRDAEPRGKVAEALEKQTGAVAAPPPTRLPDGLVHPAT
jgi:hypothetical protein